jgi:hypothetical protein
VIGKPIAVLDYDIKESKFDKDNKGKQCLHMQIKLGDELMVLFSGSYILIETMKQVPKTELPILTTIVLENDRPKFT